jgi:F0F1-type ATP synthase membrane subunit c/vacuolar-type H+-ATPase subunit K
MTKFQISKAESRNRKLMIIALSMGVGVGGIGSYALMLVATNKEWVIMVLVGLALLEGYIIGRIGALKKEVK